MSRGKGARGSGWRLGRGTEQGSSGLAKERLGFSWVLSRRQAQEAGSPR